MIPFAKTKAERTAAEDPRLSLEERYGSHAGYVAAVQLAARKAVTEGFLLAGRRKGPGGRGRRKRRAEVGGESLPGFGEGGRAKRGRVGPTHAPV